MSQEPTRSARLEARISPDALAVVKRVPDNSRLAKMTLKSAPSPIISDP
jgi:hypothetical protein